MANKTWGEYIFDTVAHNNEHVDILKRALVEVPEDMIVFNREGIENIIKLLKRNSTVIRKFDASIIDAEIETTTNEDERDC